MRLSDVRPMWILRLVPNVRFGRPLAAACVLMILLGVYAAAGMFGELPAHAPPPTVPVFFAVILAYVIPTYHYIVERCRDALADLLPHLDPTASEYDPRRAAISERSVAAQLVLLAVGVGAGIGHNLALMPSHGLWQAFTGNRFDAGIAWGTMLVWVVMTTVIAGLFQIALVFARLAKHVRIDLLQPRALTPFARVAVILTLAIIGAQAAFPILWATRDLSATASFPGLVATTVPMLFLFAMPLLPIHHAISEAKRSELARLDAIIASVTRSAPPDEAALSRLTPILGYRNEIESASEWPFDTGVTGRLAFYLIIPPFTWAGAAVIQHFVDVAL